MKKRQKKYQLGDLIVVLFEEARKLSGKKHEQNAIVQAALIDLFATRVRSKHPLSLSFHASGSH